VSITLNPLATYSFTHADVSPLPSPPWTAISGTLQIKSNKCEPIFGPGVELYVDGMVFPADQYVEFKVAALSGSSTTNDYVGGIVRNSTNSNDGYQVKVFGAAGGPGGLNLFIQDANDGIIASTTLSPAPAPGDVFQLAVLGSTIYVFQNGTQVLSVTNTTYSSGRLGLWMSAFPTASNDAVTNFAAGSVTNGPAHAISGNAGVANAVVAYSGTSAGSVTADGSGNYSIGGLADGSYTIMPSLAGNTFSPASRIETVSGADITGVNFTATQTYSISGNAGIAGATVSYSGTSAGSVTADGSGNFTISGLVNGSYSITPSLTGYAFTPTSRSETVSGSNITGVNFTASVVPNAYSVPDCRVTKPNSATSRTVNGTLIYDVQTSSNSAVPSTDSRADGAPSACGEYPQNSRTPGTFGPGE
jgi:hypothetical protein